jgi:hypothetical protein
MAPRKAPLTEPTPPITTTTKQMIRTESPMPGATEEMGLANAPARPARAAPTAKTTPNSSFTLMPSAATI